MENAYDLKVLVEKLKNHGIEATEELAKNVIEEIFGWVEESAKLSSFPYDDLGLILLPKIKEAALKQADKINKAD